MKDTKYKILAYFDNQSYRKLFNEINSDYAENLQILLHNLSLFSYDVLIIGQEYNFLYLLAATPMRVYTFEQIYQLVWKDYSIGDIKNIIWCLVKRLRKKLNTIEDGAGNCIVSVRDIGYKFELNNENEKQ